MDCAQYSRNVFSKYLRFRLHLSLSLITLVDGKILEDQNEIWPENKNESPKKHKNIISYTLHFRANLFWSLHIFPSTSTISERPNGYLVTKQSPNYHLSDLEKSVERPNRNSATVLFPNPIQEFD